MHQKWRDLEQRSREQAEDVGVTVIKDFDRRPFQAAIAPIYEKAKRDPATAALIDRIRKTE
jgi:TRAP-type C4-dicarboxylate transport system substrate-binding protein